MKYGDRVTLVQKNTDGSLRRLNAIVLASSTHTPLTHDRKVVKDAKPCLHIDLAYAVPTLVPDGGVLKTRNMEEIFRPAYDVAPYLDDAWIGYEVVADASDSIAHLETALAAERAKCGAALAEIAKLKAEPTQADLDAVAAEQAAREATAQQD